MPNLYSYCLRYDDGAAPNPYWGICTLAICKPAIRRTAKEGDWIVGHGPSSAVDPALSKSVTYAMRVDEILTMKQYDERCRERNLGKIPDWNSEDFRRKVGDCIYDYSRGRKPRLRASVHTNMNRKRDLSGRNVLWSEHFFYFGDKAIPLPEELQPILHPAQGHKVHLNRNYVGPFIAWIERLGLRSGSVAGEPMLKHEILDSVDVCTKCGKQDDLDDDYGDDAVC
jgi:hypothetical protein